MGGDSIYVDAPNANAFAGCLIGQPLRRLEHVNGGAGFRDSLGDRPRNSAPDLFVAVEQENDLALQKVSFSQQLKSGERHGNSGLHVQRSRAPKTSVPDTAWHRLERAERPDRIQMAEEQDWL